MSNELKEAVIKILEILSTVAPPEEAFGVDNTMVTAQYVIDTEEVKQCRILLEKIDPNNQQLR
tara:strand:+ start:459 stop:647 length:189 start_codon:yes stop_codon:yes gene_type:complete